MACLGCLPSFVTFARSRVFWIHTHRGPVDIRATVVCKQNNGYRGGGWVGGGGGGDDRKRQVLCRLVAVMAFGCQGALCISRPKEGP